MEEDFKTVTDFPMKTPSNVEVINQIKEDPFTDDDEANHLFQDYPGTVEEMMTPVTIIKEEFDLTIKEEPVTFEYGTSSEGSISTEFVDVGQPRFEENEIKTEEECESEMEGTSSEQVNNHFPVDPSRFVVLPSKATDPIKSGNYEIRTLKAVQPKVLQQTEKEVKEENDGETDVLQKQSLSVPNPTSTLLPVALSSLCKKHKINNQPPFCSYCLKTFINTKNKNDHVQMIHENSVERKLVCPFCKQAFMSKTSLKYHVGVSHSASGKIVKCKLCDKTFRHALSLKRHIKNMHSEDPEIYQCEECNKTFIRNDYLTVHLRLVHKTVKVSINMVNTLKQDDGSFKCKICGEVFTGLNADDDLIKHIVRKCKSEKQFLCSVCEKSFFSRFNLEQHKKIIHYEGPVNLFSCEQCQFISKHKSNLVRHQRRKHSN